MVEDRLRRRRLYLALALHARWLESRLQVHPPGRAVSLTPPAHTSYSDLCSAMSIGV